MHILYIHQYFKTPEEGGGTRSYFIAKKMIEKGHKVTMLTSTPKYTKETIKIIDGINVIYTPNKYNNTMSIPRRIISFIRFTINVLHKSLKIKNVDLIYATSTPLTIGYIPLYVKLLKRTQYIFEVRDLWPEFPIQMGAIKSKLAIKYLRSFERRIYNNSIGVVALSPGMRDGVITSNTTCNNIIMIPNMSKPDIFYPHEISTNIYQKYGINKDAFKVIYFGAMGIANGIDYILDAARILNSSHENVQFIFLGSGKDSIKIKNYINGTKESNVIYLGNQNTYITAEIANCADVSLTTFLDIPILYTNSPNKLFDSLSAGLPIIVNSKGWTKELVENEHCGFYVNPHNPLELVEKINLLKENPSLKKELSKNARAVSLNQYDKELLCEQLVEFIENSLNNKKQQAFVRN